MELWLKTCLLLCSYGLFKEYRPSEAFLTEYLLGPYQNLSEDQVYYDVYPVWTYSYVSLLIVVFLLTDLLRYKPVIIFEAAGYVATWCLLLWATGVHWMQFMQFCYGIASSTEVAYYTYIYAQVDGRYYQKVTSYTRTAVLFGRFLSDTSGQILTSTDLMDYHSLNYISLASVSIAFVIAVLLPPVKTSIYFHREGIAETNASEQNSVNSEEIETAGRASNAETRATIHVDKESNRFLSIQKIKNVIGLLTQDFKEAYTNKYILKWSIWWACASCINYQVGNYIQPLYESIMPFEDADNLYNGAVGATSTLLGALAALSVGYLHLNWELVGELTLAIISLLDASILLFMGLTSHIMVAYIGYILFRSSYQVLITVASYQVAKNLRADSYGLIFGINMFLALLLESILTVIVADWLEIDPGLQFVIYGGLFCLLSFLFFIFASYTVGRLGFLEIRRQGLWISQDTQ